MNVLLTLPGWLTSEGDITLATWGLVIATLVLGGATFLLYLDGIRKSREQRERWKREDEQARIREKQELTNRLAEQFNAPIFMVTRAELAYQLLGELPQSVSGTERAPKSPRFRLDQDIPFQAWNIVNFFERLARQWKNNLLNTDAVDFVFGDYLLIFAGEFKSTLTADKYEALNELVKTLSSRREHASETPGVDSLSAGWSQARQTFWYAEYKLFRLLTGELPPLQLERR